MIGFSIFGGKGRTNSAEVTRRGQLVTAPLDFSKFYNAIALLVNTGYTVISPVQNKQFVITDIVLYANKDVGPSDATVELYEAEGEDSDTVESCIFKQEILKNDSVLLTGLNILVPESTWVNVKTDDNVVFANISGYYIKALR